MRANLRLSALFVAMLAVHAHAQQPPAGGAGDARQGLAIVEKDCNACHVRRFGDVAAAYTRIDRRVNNAAQLKAQIAYCNSQLGAGYFPEEEDHIAAYLDHEYYHFKP
jgi:cytochrome c551/c552